MSDFWHNYDASLTTAEKNYIYLALPLNVGEDSVSVENFLELVWARPLTMPDLVQFCEEFRLWVREDAVMNDSDLTDEEVFLAWRKVINRDRTKLRSLTDKLMYKARRVDELEAKLALADEYGEFCAGGGGRHLQFVKWLDLREGK